jgi:nucleotide-binding universal stress UspA family protein
MKIVLAIDGSSSSQAATQALALQMRPEGAEVLVLEVVEPLVYSTPPQMAQGYAPELVDRMREEVSQARNAVEGAAEILRAKGFSVKTRVVEAEVRGGILDVAGEWQADLIVVGSHGRKGISRFMLGSVAESVARHAACSVMIVRTPAQS